MERFPALNLILRYGGAGSLVMACVAAIAIACVLWSALGWFAIVCAAAAGAVLLLILKACVELVTLITEMLVPR